MDDKSKAQASEPAAEGPRSSTEKVLLVYVNPHLQHDHLGRPCAVVAHENAPGQYVGARIKKATTVDEKSALYADDVEHHVEWEFDEGPIAVPNTAYYRTQIASGALVPHDAFAAKKAGVAFEEPQKRLDAHREAMKARMALEGDQPEKKASEKTEAKS